MIKNLVEKLKRKFKEKLFLADVLLMTSIFIIFFTTLALNKYVAMYLLAVILVGVSYLIQKGEVSK